MPERNNGFTRKKREPKLDNRKEFVIKTQDRIQTRTTEKIYRTSMARTLNRHGGKL